MWKHPSAPGPALREVIGAWLVCFVVAAGCFTLLAAAAPVPDGPAKALIGRGPAATGAAAGADRRTGGIDQPWCGRYAGRRRRHRHGRC